MSRLVATHLLRSKEEAERHLNSSDTQLVGYVTLDMDYNTPDDTSVSSAQTACTVIYSGKSYYAVDGWPEGFLKSLLKKEDYPLIAKEGNQRRLLRSASDKEAIEEAKDILKEHYFD